MQSFYLLLVHVVACLMAIRYRSEGFYLSFHLYLSVNVALVNEQANQLCEFGENYFGGSQK